MNNPLKSLDQVKASNELKDRTYKHVLAHKKAKKTFRIFQGLSAGLVCAFAAILVFINLPQTPNKIVNTATPTPIKIQYRYVSIDINPSMQFKLDESNKIITTETFNEDANNIIKSLSIKGLSINEGLNMLFENPTFNNYVQEGILEVGVYSSDKQASTALENDLNAYLAKYAVQGSYHCTSLDDTTYNLSQSHHASSGKSRVVSEVLKYDTSHSFDELLNLSMRDLYLILAKYDVSQIPANCQHGQMNGQMNGQNGGANHQQGQGYNRHNNGSHH